MSKSFRQTQRSNILLLCLSSISKILSYSSSCSEASPRFGVIVEAKPKEERYEMELRWSIKRRQESHICLPPPSLFICFALLFLFLLDGVIALESKTSSLFLSFSYSMSQQIITILKVVVIVPLQRSFLSAQLSDVSVSS